MDEQNSSDESLVRSARQGNRESFDALVRRYQLRAVSLAQSILRNRELAMDASQNAFAKAYFALKHFREEAKFKTWFFKILMNEARDMLRKEKVRGVFRLVGQQEGAEEESESILELTPSPNRSPKEELEAKERKERLEQAIGKLPGMERAVFVLRYLQDMPLAEIAQVLGIAVGTVKAHLAHASEKLKKMLQPEISSIR